MFQLIQKRRLYKFVVSLFVCSLFFYKTTLVAVDDESTNKPLNIDGIDNKLLDSKKNDDGNLNGHQNEMVKKEKHMGNCQVDGNIQKMNFQIEGEKFFRNKSVERAVKKVKMIHDNIIITRHKVTPPELDKLKKLVGIYDKNKNYNMIIDGHGTGYCPPTEEEWEQIAQEAYIVDHVSNINSLFSNSSFSKPSRVDNMEDPWFPPIGDQDGKGSCTCWAVGYYIKTYQEAKEHGWDLSGAKWEQNYVEGQTVYNYGIWDWGEPTPAYQDKIFSPDFIYHQINYGTPGSSAFNAMNLINSIGACTWDKMPYDPTNETAWPSEDAYRQAPLYRSETGCNYWYFDDDGDIEDLKTYLAGDRLAFIAIAAGDYNYLIATPWGDLWTMETYSGTGINHANTIVGYDDNFGPYLEEGETRYGAFKIANSHGYRMRGDHDHDGCYWISYKAMKERVRYCCIFEDAVGYEPELISVFQINHTKRDECSITVGIGSADNPLETKQPNWHGGNYPFPSNKIILDITEFNNSVATPIGHNFFIQIHDTGSDTVGIITNFSIEYYSNYTTSALIAGSNSNDPPLDTINGYDVLAQTGLFVVPPTNDVGIKSINYPEQGKKYSTGSLTVNTTVRNYGTYDQTNVSVNCSIFEYDYISYSGFEEDPYVPPSGWYAVNGANSSKQGWYDSYYGAPFAGDHWAYSWPEGEGKADCWLITPQLNVPENGKLTFWYRAEGDGIDVALEVNVSTSSNQTNLSSFSTRIWDSGITSDENYTKVNVDLSAYANQSIYIGFHQYYCEEYPNPGEMWWGILLDDVYIYNSTYILRVYGEEETISHLSSGEETYVEFDTPWAITEEGKYIVSVTTQLLVDEFPYNNKTNTTIQIKNIHDIGVSNLNHPPPFEYIPPGNCTINATVKNNGTLDETDIGVNCSIYQCEIKWSESFENYSSGIWSLPTSWNALDFARGGGVGYWLNSYYGVPLTGNHWMYAWGYGYTPDCWLLTKQITVPLDGKLSFWYRAEERGYPVAFEVKLSFGPQTDASSYTTLLWDSGTFDYEEYTLQIIDLSSFEGQNVYIGFHFYWASDPWWGFYLDDVSLLRSTYVYGDNETCSLSSGETTYVEFTPPWHADIGTYLINISTNLTRDGNPVNDIQMAMLYVGSSVVHIDDDFNSSTPGWNIVNFSKIQKGVNSVLPAGKIYVHNGTYYENVYIDKPVAIIGEDEARTIINGEWNDYAFSISIDSVHISNFTMENSSGIKIEHGENVSINGNTILYNGIYCQNSKNVKICNNNIDHYVSLSESIQCDIRNNYFGMWGGLLIDGDTLKHFVHEIENNTINGDPIHYFLNETSVIINESWGTIGELIFINCSSFDIYNLTISNAYVGIESAYSQNFCITNTTIINNNYGIYLYASPFIIIDNNTISGCWCGIYLDSNSDYCMINANEIYSNTNHGIFFHFSTNATLSKNKIYGNTNGIWLEWADRNRIYNNEIYNNGNDGIHLYRSSSNEISKCNVRNNTGYGLISEYYSRYNCIADCDFYNNSYYGIYICQYSTLNSINNCKIYNNLWDGIALDYASLNHVNKCNVYNNTGHGIILLHSNVNYLTSCTIHDHINHSVYLCSSSSYNYVIKCGAYNSNNGISLNNSCNYNTISNCNTSNNNYGIYAECSDNNIVSNCIFLSNHYGLLLFQSDNNSIYHNNFINNTNQSYDSSSSNTWDNGYPSGGNYWSDFDEPSEGAWDNDSDGIVDSPYNISGGSSKDNYPFMNPNGWLWWDYSWFHRKPINLWVSSGSTPSNYQILLNITYNASMNPDFGDLRFIRYADNTTELDYWIEKKIDGSWCNVWVEIADNITTENKTLAWMYYGNPNATSASNGDETFLFFDDFNDGIYRDKWNIDENSGNIGTAYQLNGKLFLRTKEIDRTISLITKESFESLFDNNNGTILEYDVWTRYSPPYPKGKDGSLRSYIINESNNKWIGGMYAAWSGNVKLESNGNVTILGRTSRRTNNIHAFVSLGCNESNAFMRWKEINDPGWIEDDFNDLIQTNMAGIASIKIKIELHCGGSKEGQWSQIAFDNLRLGKYHDPEPEYYIG